MSGYRYDTTQISTSAATSATGDTLTLRDYMGFGSSVAPVAVDNGRYGIPPGDDHSFGKPSVGVHLSVEADALAGSDYFSDAAEPFWVGGAQKFPPGTLASGESVAISVLLSVKTGTVVGTGGGGGGGGGGGVDGSSNGGADVDFEGEFFAEYDSVDADELAEHVAARDFLDPDFAIAGALQLFEIEFSGAFHGLAQIALGYDPSLIGAYSEIELGVYHFYGGVWQFLGGVVDPVRHTITVTTDAFSPFAIGASPDSGAVPEPGTVLAGLATAGLAIAGYRRARRNR